MSFLFKLDRRRLEPIAKDYVNGLTEYATYDKVYIHTFVIRLTDDEFERIRYNDFCQYRIFTMHTKSQTPMTPPNEDDAEDNDPRPSLWKDSTIKDAFSHLLIHRIDGLSDNYEDAFPSVAMYYDIDNSNSEMYDISIIENLRQNKLHYFRDMGSRKVLPRTADHTYTSLIANGFWKMDTEKTSSYYLGTAQINRKESTETVYSADEAIVCPYDTFKFISIMSITKSKEVYDIRDFRRFIEKYRYKIKVDSLVPESYINTPRLI